MHTEDTIATLTREFAADPRIGCSLLFGSVAKGVGRPGSDLDIAIAARSAGDAASLRDGLLALRGTLTVAAGRDVDLVLLDDLEPTLGHQVMLDHRVLFDHDRKRTARLFEHLLLAYFDGEYYRRIADQALNAREAARRGRP